MKMKVYHSNKLVNPFDKNLPKFPDEYTLVAEVEALDVDMAYHYTNSFGKPWTENEQVKAVDKNLRSTSVGDVIVDEEGNKWYCDLAGWKFI